MLVALAVLTTTSATATASKRTGTVAQRQVVSLLNDVRDARGLPPLALRRTLSIGARAHARDMVQRNYFDHDTLNGPSWDSRVSRLVGPRHTFGENIGWGSFASGTPDAIVHAWMNSTGHRRNILDPAFRLIGVGIATGSFQGHGEARVYVTDFGG